MSVRFRISREVYFGIQFSTELSHLPGSHDNAGCAWISRGTFMYENKARLE